MVFADHNAPGDFSTPGCVLGSPSWAAGGSYYPGNVATIAEDYFFNWTRDAAIAFSAVLAGVPDQLPSAAASHLLADYVFFASTCQRGSGGQARRSTRPRATQRGRADESDGPALRVLTVLQGFAALDSQAQLVAKDVIAADLGYLLGNNRYQSPTVTLWEDTYGQSIFARAVQLRCLNQVIAVGPGLGIAVPSTAAAAASWLHQQLPLHWSGTANCYLSVLGAERLSGDPEAIYDPSIDPVLACVYGDGIACTDPRLLSTAALVRAQWGPGGVAGYPINVSDAAQGIGPLLGRYLGDEYDGLSLTSDTGHPGPCAPVRSPSSTTSWPAINGGTAVPADPLATAFLTQVGVNVTTPGLEVVTALRAAGDSMLNAVIYHSNSFELSEQFDQATGYEKSVSNLTWSYAAFLSAVAARADI